MSVNEKMTDIADRLRGYNQETDKLSLDSMCLAIDRAFRAGVETGKTIYDSTKSEEFWDVFQANGTRTDYSFAFVADMFTDSSFTPKYKIKVKNAEKMFYQSFSNLTDLSGVDMDFSECTNFTASFANSCLRKLGNISTVSATELTRTFQGCDVVIIGDFTVKENTIFTNTFSMCNDLEDITFKGVIGQDLVMNRSPLNKASIESILGCLSATATGKTLTLKPSQVDKVFETSEGAGDGVDSDEWCELIETKINWTIVA